MPTTSTEETIPPPCYQSDYRLDSDYFAECFDESKQPVSGLAPYAKAGILLAVAAALSMTEISPYAPWFLLALGIVEFLSVRYQRSWWIARQLFSRASGSLIQLTIDDTGIRTETPLHQQQISWDEVAAIEETERGFIVQHPGGRHYLSKQALSAEAQDYLQQRRC